MMYFTLELFFVIFTTVLASYGMFYTYLLRRNNKDLYQGLNDISVDLNRLKKIEKGIELVPEKIQSSLEQTQTTIMEHTSRLAEEIRAQIILGMDKNIETFEKNFYNIQNNLPMDNDQRLRWQEHIQQFIDHKMERMLQTIKTPQNKQGDTQLLADFQVMSKQLHHVNQALNMIEKRQNNQEKYLQLVSERLQKILKGYNNQKQYQNSHQRNDSHTNNVVYFPSRNPKKTNADDLTQIKGIGKFTEKILNRHFRISTFEQLAQLSPEMIEEIQKELFFPGKIDREKWIQQAKRWQKKAA